MGQIKFFRVVAPRHPWAIRDIQDGDQDGRQPGQNTENSHISETMCHRLVIFAPKGMFSGTGNSMAPSKFISHNPFGQRSNMAAKMAAVSMRKPTRKMLISLKPFVLESQFLHRRIGFQAQGTQWRHVN